jgi:tRNA threonylcarbamoyladenosine biosynthesis protein TsaE
MATPVGVADARLLVPDPGEMHRLGAAFGTVARAGEVICLYGDLGAGKTVFAKGLAAGLGVQETVSSPSFILMAEYPGRLRLFHIDLYRLADAAEALAGGLLDERQAEGVTVIEWAERLGESRPAGRVDVRIGGSGDAARDLDLAAADDEHRWLLDRAIEQWRAGVRGPRRG